MENLDWERLYARAVTSACRRPWNWPFCTTQSQPYLQQLALALAQASRLSLVGAHFTEACQCTWLGLQPQASALGGAPAWCPAAVESEHATRTRGPCVKNLEGLDRGLSLRFLGQ